MEVGGVEQKTVSDLIFDKFEERIEGNDLFKGISDDLISLARQTKPNRDEIAMLLRKKQDENSKSGD